MKKIIILLLLLPIIGNTQKYITKTGKISFYSDAPLEKIEAANNQVNASLDIVTGNFVFKVLMKSFEFPKSLMQEHFNEDYVESDKYPNATFTGKITNIKDINVANNNSVIVNVMGELTIHGVTNKITTSGTIMIKDGVLTGNSKFTIKLKDYNISIPKIVINNISETLEITVNIILHKLDN
jgi:polyisoprenoid-binding protein YceI